MAMMGLKQAVLLQCLLFFFLAATPLAAYADPAIISRAEESIEVTGGSTGATPTTVERTQIVTIETDLGSDSEVERALTIATQLTEAAQDTFTSQNDPMTYVEITNPDAPLSNGEALAFSQFRAKFSQGQSRSFQFSRETIENLKKAPRILRTGIAATATDKYKATLAIIKISSATLATSLAVIATVGTPHTAAAGLELFARSLPTGIMSALFIVLGDQYAEYSIKPGRFSRHIDDANWLRQTVGFFKKPFGTPAERKRAEGLIPFKAGLYLDQFLFSLKLELPFVYISSMFSNGFEAANSSIMHILDGVLKGGAGQMFFDQAAAIISKSHEAKVIEKFPPGPERDRRLKFNQRARDTAFMANSLAQVWMVMPASRGYVLAETALQIYMVAGFVTRISLIPLENRLTKRESHSELPLTCSLIWL